MPIVELEKGVYLAPWEGDPGRTLDIRTAKKFKTRKDAEFALMGARNWRPFRNAVIRPTPRAVDGGQAGENNGQVALPTATNASRWTPTSKP